MDTQAKRIAALNKAIAEVKNNEGENIEHIYAMSRELHAFEAAGGELTHHEDRLWETLTHEILELEEQHR